MLREKHSFSADYGSTMTVQFSAFTPAQLLCNWHEQRPSNEGDLDSGSTERLGRPGVDFIFLSYTWLFRGCVANGTSCIIEEVGVAATTPYAWIQEALGSNIGWRGLPQILKANSGAVARLPHDQFLSNPFPFISRQSQYDLTLHFLH